MSNTPYQDFKVVTLRRNKTKAEKARAGETDIVRRRTDNKQSGATLSQKAAHDFDPENATKIVTSNRDLGIALQKARTALKMSQSDVDKACSFAKNTVRDYENGKAVIVPAQINKMNLILKTKLPRPKK